MEEYLLSGTLPKQEYAELVIIKAPHFLLKKGD